MTQMTKGKSGNPYYLGKDYLMGKVASLLGLSAFVISFFFPFFVCGKDLDILTGIFHMTMPCDG